MEEPKNFPLHEAARDGRTNTIESLLSVNPKLARQKDDDGRYAVHWAVSSNQLDVLKIFASTPGFDPDVQDGSGWTLLMIAASLKDGEHLVDLLLQKGADVNAKNFAGQTALHFVTSKKNLELARCLLNHQTPASLRISDKLHQYPIHRAAAVGSVPLVNLFILHQSPLNPADIAGQTPLHHAIAEGHGDTAISLLKAGANVQIRDLDDHLALDLAPDTKIKRFIIQEAEKEGIVI